MIDQLKRALVFGMLLLLQWSLHGQTIVSTQTENKRPVLEEFGGIYCVYCPQGHAVVNDLLANYEEELLVLNYHTGSYAIPIGDDPDLRSPYGEVIDDQTGLTGYPAGTVNRHVFSGLEQGVSGTTALSRSNWEAAIEDISQESALVNLAAEATLNIATRELELYIEYYYTGDAAEATNRLNVAVLQNNILAPQVGGGAGSYYNHQHVVRDMLTGQWGHVIDETDAGSFGSLTYSLTLPEFYNDIWVDPVNIEFAIFIAEENQEILNGIKVQPDLTTHYNSDVRLISVIGAESVCNADFDGSITFRNDGNEPLTSLQVVSTIWGGGYDSVPWSGYLNPLESVTLPLNPLFVDQEVPMGQLSVRLSSPNGVDDPTAENNERDHFFQVAPMISDYTLELVLHTDDYGYELYWEVVDEFGEIQANGGNEVVQATGGGAQLATPFDEGAYGSNAFVVEEISLPAQGCYTLRVLDDYGDGMCCYYGNGFYRLRPVGGDAFLTGGAFGATDEKRFALDFSVSTSTQDAPVDDAALLFPNPVKVGEAIQVKGLTGIQWQWSILNTNGQLLRSGAQNDPISTNRLPAGFYYVQLTDGQQRWSFPVIIQP